MAESAKPHGHASGAVRGKKRRSEQIPLFPVDSVLADDGRPHPMLAYERECRAEGFLRIAGVDEAGRGPLAGPIVAAAVVLAEYQPGLNDSKQLTPKLRDLLYEALVSGEHDIGISVIGPEEIDSHGIQWANYTAMTRALADLRTAPDFALVDGFAIPGCSLPHRRIIKGDSLSFSIAAASIVAKVTRDRILKELDRAHPGYGFRRHKGYGTREHLAALEQFGPCPAHRMTFAPIAKSQETAALFHTEDSTP